MHVIGKGILRFHAVYWPAILLSAQQSLPTAVFVHDYLTVQGLKLSKSLGTAIEPLELIRRYGTDALRWWFVRDVPRVGDADVREELLAARANELADDLGNLINRTITLVGRFRPEGVRPACLLPEKGHDLREAIDRAQTTTENALGHFEFRAAAAAVWKIVIEANRFVSETRPWKLDRRSARTIALHRILSTACLRCCFLLAE